MKTPFSQPEISFAQVDQKSILKKDDRIVEIGDLSPDAFGEFIDEHEPLLIDQLKAIDDATFERTLRPPRLAPVIYMARFSLLKDSIEIFNEHTLLQRNSRNETTPNNLREEYLPYWRAVRDRKFLPFIGTVILPADPKMPAKESYNGTWLGLTRSQR